MAVAVAPRPHETAHTMNCRTVDEVRAAAQADHDGPMDQDQADQVAAILAPYQDKGAAA